MNATRLPRLHVITDTRGPVARANPSQGAVLTADRTGTPSHAAADLHYDGSEAESGTRRFVTESAGAQRDPLIVIEAALAAGARLVQIRPEDHYTDRAAFDLATAIAALCDQYEALCLVNDRVHLAQAVGADGVHLGADDLPIDAARRILPAASIIGGTARDPESARAARRAGATYLGVGPVWGTTTKSGLPQPIGLEGLAAVCEAVDLPVIAIGGITAERAALCREAGAHGVAVVGAVSAAADPTRATAELLAAVGESSTGGAEQGGARGAFNADRPRAGASRGSDRAAGVVGGLREMSPVDASDRSADMQAGSDIASTRVLGEDPDSGVLRGVGEA